LKILKEKPIKSIRIKAHLNSNMYSLGTKKFDKKKKKKIISKEFLKKKSNLKL